MLRYYRYFQQICFHLLRHHRTVLVSIFENVQSVNILEENNFVCSIDVHVYDSVMTMRWKHVYCWCPEYTNKHILCQRRHGDKVKMALLKA